ncbi:MAG TPA: hypothetical protein VN693_01485 [Rhodanobacteraceae bacterium]|nr:hypothetical protein [Rhodanobacteraceae bacterium]
MRIAVAALFGAIVIFLWQFVSHMVLPIGEMGFRAPQNEQAVLQAAVGSLPASGLYLLPYLAPDKMKDPAAVQAWTAEAQKNPSLFVAVSPPNATGTDMAPELVKQFVTNLLGALLVAFVLAAAAWSFGMRVLGSTIFGVFGWLLNIVPMWNWYRFPADYMIGNLLDQGIGWLLAGIAIAWWLGRRRSSRL